MQFEVPNVSANLYYNCFPHRCIYLKMSRNRELDSAQNIVDISYLCSLFIINLINKKEFIIKVGSCELWEVINHVNIQHTANGTNISTTSDMSLLFIATRHITNIISVCVIQVNLTNIFSLSSVCGIQSFRLQSILRVSRIKTFLERQAASSEKKFCIIVQCVEGDALILQILAIKTQKLYPYSLRILLIFSYFI